MAVGSPGISAELVTTITIGVVMFCIGMYGLWQTHRARRHVPNTFRLAHSIPR